MYDKKPRKAETHTKTYISVFPLVFEEKSPWKSWNLQMSSSREGVQKEENERVSKCLFLFYHCKNKDILLYPWPIRSLTC